jgi:hypothetical protein
LAQLTNDVNALDFSRSIARELGNVWRNAEAHVAGHRGVMAADNGGSF